MPYPERFYPIVDSLAWIERLTQLGVRTVQLRAKDLSHDDAVRLVREALAVTAGASPPLVVEDYWQGPLRGGGGPVSPRQDELGRGPGGPNPPAGAAPGGAPA